MFINIRDYFSYNVIHTNTHTTQSLYCIRSSCYIYDGSLNFIACGDEFWFQRTTLILGDEIGLAGKFWLWVVVEAYEDGNEMLDTFAIEMRIVLELGNTKNLFLEIFSEIDFNYFTLWNASLDATK